MQKIQSFLSALCIKKSQKVSLEVLQHNQMLKRVSSGFQSWKQQKYQIFYYFRGLTSVLEEGIDVVKKGPKMIDVFYDNIYYQESIILIKKFPIRFGPNKTLKQQPLLKLANYYNSLNTQRQRKLQIQQSKLRSNQLIQLHYKSCVQTQSNVDIYNRQTIAYCILTTQRNQSICSYQFSGRKEDYIVARVFLQQQMSYYQKYNKSFGGEISHIASKTVNMPIQLIPFQTKSYQEQTILNMQQNMKILNFQFFQSNECSEMSKILIAIALKKYNLYYI
ncbi:Hypothetical_protein [Hexamita inflata]|uniref:Hypothetical_protein n=1 Tax=Hexamita inflata TaxID=28002 RepID=A0AA86VA04_9EUKA|nr:Hypothetical protein HINF_LOCUS48258 [Hexamita inflata]